MTDPSFQPHVARVGTNPMILARIPREQLEQLRGGYGWTPYLVEGHEY